MEKTIKIMQPLEVVFMNRASLVVSIDGERYFVTRRIFNEMQSGKYSGIVFVISKPDKMGNLLKWLAIPTIF